jgi:hypothetical protein
LQPKQTIRLGRSQVETESRQHEEKSLISGCWVICSSVRLSFLTFGGKAEGARLPGRTKVTGLALPKVAVRACRCTAFPAYSSTVTCSSADFYLSPFICLHFSVTFTVYKYALSPSPSVIKILFQFLLGFCSGKLDDATERSFSWRQISNL